MTPPTEAEIRNWAQQLKAMAVKPETCGCIRGDGYILTCEEHTEEIRKGGGGEEVKYRKKPVVIEAQQFWANSHDGWPQGVYKDGDGWAIDTLEGPYVVSEGDYIITGVKGERYPCKPDIFELTYEKVEA
jgi:hypothetical protein